MSVLRQYGRLSGPWGSTAWAMQSSHACPKRWCQLNTLCRTAGSELCRRPLKIRLRRRLLPEICGAVSGSGISDCSGRICSNPMGEDSSGLRKSIANGCFARRSDRMLRISGGASQSSSDNSLLYRIS